jgi:hypothetical protein
MKYFPAITFALLALAFLFAAAALNIYLHNIKLRERVAELEQNREKVSLLIDYVDLSQELYKSDFHEFTLEPGDSESWENKPNIHIMALKLHRHH